MISTLLAIGSLPQRLTALPVDPQQDAQADAAHYQRTAAIAEEWQGQPLGRQQADIHADVDQHLAAPHDRQAIGQIGREQAPGAQAQRPVVGAEPASIASRAKAARAPTMPSSSASTENTKSVWASGR